MQRSLQEAEAQSFQLYHAQVDRAIRKTARQRHKELVTDEMLDNEMAILAPLQEGMQALPAEDARSVPGG